MRHSEINKWCLGALAGLSGLLFSGGLEIASADNADALEKVRLAEGVVSMFAIADVSESRFDRALSDLDDCKEAVTGAIKAGVSPDTYVPVIDSKHYSAGRETKKPGYTATHQAPLRQIRDRCDNLHHKVRLLPAVWGIERAQSHQKQLEALSEPDYAIARLAEYAYDGCLKGVERSVSLGAASSDKLVVGALTVAISEAAELGCKPLLAAIAEVKGGVESAEAARFAPYRKVLKRDKIRVFIDSKMISFRVYGQNGIELATPAQLAKSRVWFEHLRSGSSKRWAMKRFQFNRKHVLISTRRINGPGRTPPSRAYR